VLQLVGTAQVVTSLVKDRIATTVVNRIGGEVNGEDLTTTRVGVSLVKVTMIVSQVIPRLLIKRISNE
jgi:hypothetical protein